MIGKDDKMALSLRVIIIFPVRTQNLHVHTRCKREGAWLTNSLNVFVDLLLV